MQTSRDVFAAELKKLIQERIHEISNDLIYGAGVTSFEGYREKVGEIRGLRTAIETLEAAEQRTDAIERGK